MNQRAIVTAGILAVFLWIFLGFFLVIPWPVASVLVAVSIGVPSLLLLYERSKSGVSISQTKPAALTVETKGQKDTTGSSLLPDITEITQLRIDNNLLDQTYEQARKQAIDINNDAQLSRFTIQVFPFQEATCKVHIYFDFYSKWTDKQYSFRYSEDDPQVVHVLPDKRAKIGYDREVFKSLPWKDSPQWMQFLNKVYVKIKPLNQAMKTCYHLSASAYAKETPWRVTFEDGFSGNDYTFKWDGKGLGEDSIKQEH
jgi:hypothetical protein